MGLTLGFTVDSMLHRAYSVRSSTVVVQVQYLYSIFVKGYWFSLLIVVSKRRGPFL